ncbi:unnamed protein product, partial [Meganyctiphanes norvegica]
MDLTRRVCANCNGNHHAKYRECNYYKNEIKIVNTMIELEIHRHMAKQYIQSEVEVEQEREAEDNRRRIRERDRNDNQQLNREPIENYPRLGTSKINTQKSNDRNLYSKKFQDSAAGAGTRDAHARVDIIEKATKTVETRSIETPTIVKSNEITQLCTTVIGQQENHE